MLEEYELCRNCDGTGEVHSDSPFSAIASCTVCNGTGIVTKFQSLESTVKEGLDE